MCVPAVKSNKQQLKKFISLAVVVKADTNPPVEDLEYRLKQIDTDGVFEYFNETFKVNASVTNVEEPSVDGLPTKFALNQNYPNPFNPSTSISYNIPESGLVELNVYDMLGNKIKTLVNEQKSAGNYEVRFDASNLSSGMYIYRLITSGFTETKKMLFMK